jgi:uncharacterized membrane protein
VDILDALWLARALHVVGVVLWIGGVSFVTLTLLPTIRRDFPPELQLAEFERYERKFGQQARWITQLVGASGLFITWKTELWFRFVTSGYGWMHTMVAVYLLFTLLLFVVEPLFFHQFLRRLAARSPTLPMLLLLRVHWLLTSVSLLVIAAAIVGAHGWNYAGAGR